MKNRFLNISVGVSIMLLSGGFFLRSVPTATAAPSPETFVEEGTNKIGKYMMQIFPDPSESYRYHAYVWDTETGKSQGYYLLGSDWMKERGLPVNPLGE